MPFFGLFRDRNPRSSVACWGNKIRGLLSGEDLALNDEQREAQLEKGHRAVNVHFQARIEALFAGLSPPGFRGARNAYGSRRVEALANAFALDKSQCWCRGRSGDQGRRHVREPELSAGDGDTIETADEEADFKPFPCVLLKGYMEFLNEEVTSYPDPSGIDPCAIVFTPPPFGSEGNLLANLPQLLRLPELVKQEMDWNEAGPEIVEGMVSLVPNYPPDGTTYTTAEVSSFVEIASLTQLALHGHADFAQSVLDRTGELPPRRGARACPAHVVLRSTSRRCRLALRLPRISRQEGSGRLITEPPACRGNRV
jgi:hypothetical protein